VQAIISQNSDLTFHDAEKYIDAPNILSNHSLDNELESFSDIFSDGEIDENTFSGFNWDNDEDGEGRNCKGSWRNECIPVSRVELRTLGLIYRCRAELGNGRQR